MLVVSGGKPSSQSITLTVLSIKNQNAFDVIKNINNITDGKQYVIGKRFIVPIALPSSIAKKILSHQLYAEKQLVN